MISTRWISGAILAITLLSAADARAQKLPKPKASPPSAAAPPVPAPEDPKQRDAREHFERGMQRSMEEAWDAALAEFKLSRELVARPGSTKNAAISLRKLHRYDEALDMFEALLHDFPDVAADDKQFAEKNIAELQALVGFLDLRGVAAGTTLNVDGRDLGEFRPGKPVRVSAGTRMVRLYKSGFSPIEKRVDVPGQQTVVVEAQMAALAQAGRLKVTEQSGKAVDVLVDNVVVGKTPWEGDLALGEHVVALRGEGNTGTAPVSASVRLNEATPLALSAEELDATIRIEATPPSSSVALDGVTVGRGAWEGRLRSGDHQVSVTADGFLGAVKPVALAHGGREVVALKLERDPKSPIWGEQARNRVVVEFSGGAAVAPSFGGSCDAPCSAGLGLGFLGRLHVAYELDSGLLLGLSGGYLTATQHVTGRPSSITPFGKAAIPGTLDDTLQLRGFAVGATGGFHSGRRFPITLRLGAGALIASLADDRNGTFGATQETISESPKATYFYVSPEARLGARFLDHFELSLGAEAMILFALSKPVANAQSQVNVPGQGLAPFGFQNEQIGGGAMLILVPSLALRADF